MKIAIVPVLFCGADHDCAKGPDAVVSGKIFAGMKVGASLKGDAVFKPSDPFDFHF